MVIETTSSAWKADILAIVLHLHKIDNSTYHELLPYLCIYTIAEAHLVLSSHPYIVIAQVQ